MITFSLGIPHTPWKRERVESCARLVDALTPTPREVLTHRLFTDRSANWQWSEAMWRWGARTESSHFLSLQDDVIPSPNFWPELRAMVEAYPRDVIGLESAHPECAAALKRVERMVTTSDGLIGVGYVIPTGLLREFLAWRATLIKGAVESITEDSLLCVWCLATGRRIYHPVPTIIDHDISLKSTYGNEKHDHRRPVVTWKDWTPGIKPEWWNTSVTHLGSFYGGRVAQLARRWIPGATDADWEKWREA